MVNKYSQKLARLYKAHVELYKLIIEDAETSKIEAAVSRVATLSSEVTEMPHIPETVKEWHERIMEKAFPKNVISGSPNSAARGTAPPAAGSGVPGQMVTPRGAACGLTAGAVTGRGPVTGVISWRAKPGTQNDSAERATGITVAAGRFPRNLGAALIHEKGSRDFHLIWQSASGQALQLADLPAAGPPARQGPRHRRRTCGGAAANGAGGLVLRSRPRRTDDQTVVSLEAVAGLAGRGLPPRAVVPGVHRAPDQRLAARGEIGAAAAARPDHGAAATP
jgi:hypothetical protein